METVPETVKELVGQELVSEHCTHLKRVRLRNTLPRWIPFVKEVPCALVAKTSSPSPAKILQTVDLPERAGPTTGAPHIQFSPIKSGISGAGARHQVD